MNNSVERVKVAIKEKLVNAHALAISSLKAEFTDDGTVIMLYIHIIKIIRKIA